MSTDKIKSKVAYKLQHQNPSSLILNPLRSNNSIKWFKGHKQSNLSYTTTVNEKLRMFELKRLFERFDINLSGTIDLDELGLMFETAGLIINSEIL